MTESKMHEVPSDEEMRRRVKEPSQAEMQQIQAAQQRQFMYEMSKKEAVWVDNFTIMQQGSELIRITFAENSTEGMLPHARLVPVMHNSLARALHKYLGEMFEKIDTAEAAKEAAQNTKQ